MRLAWPAIAVNITTPLLGLVDVAIVGHIGSAVFIGAIAVGGTMFSMLYWLFGFLRMGTSGVTAQAYGARDTDNIRGALERSLLLALLAGILLICLAEPLGDVVLKFIDADDSAQTLARMYFNIVIFGAPAVMTTYALSGWFLGMQDSRPILWMSLTANILNIIVSLVLVFVFRLQLAGVAAGTMSAQWAGAFIGLAIVIRKLRKDVPSPVSTLRRRIFMRGEMGRVFRINSDIFLRTLCLVSVTVWFTHAGAQQGVDTLAANALMMQLFLLFSYFMDGFAFAGEALAGRFCGEHNASALNDMISRLFRIGFILAAICTVVYFIFGNGIFAILTDDKATLRLAAHYRLWIAAVPLAGFASFLWDGIYIGLTRTRLMLLTMAVSTAVFFILWFTLADTYANHALWLAFITYLLSRGLLQTFLYRR